MKYVVPGGHKMLRVDDVPIPKPKDDQVLIKVIKCSICGSDLHAWREGELHIGEPIGHEMVGTIVNAGKFTDKFQIGDRVNVMLIPSCDACDFCKEGLISLCQSIDWAVNPSCMSEYVAYMPGKLVKIPDNLSDEEAALADPVAVALHAVRLSGVKKNDKVLITGGGVIGAFIAECCRNIGIEKIVVTDINDNRLQQIMKIGSATACFNAKRKDLIEALAKEAGDDGKYNVYFDATGIVSVINQVLCLLKPRGIFMVVGIGTSSKQVPFDFDALLVNEHMVQASFCYASNDFRDAVDLMSNGQLNIKPYVGKTFALDQAQEAFEYISDPAAVDFKAFISGE